MGQCKLLSNQPESSSNHNNHKNFNWKIFFFILLGAIVVYGIYNYKNHNKNPDITEHNDELVKCDYCNISDNIPGKCPICKGTRLIGNYAPVECIFCIDGNCYKCKGKGMIFQSEINKPLPNPEVILQERVSSTHGGMAPCTECNGSGLMLKTYICPSQHLHDCIDQYCEACRTTHCRNNTIHVQCWKCNGKKEVPSP